MTNAMPSWSWTGCEERKANVEVYARAARVELVLNGHTVGSKTLKNDCLARFSIPYESSTLKDVSYDAADHEISRCKLQSAGGTTRLTLDAEEPTVKPGHLCYVRLRYTDENGITKPLARGNIQGWAVPAPSTSTAIWTAKPIPTTARLLPSSAWGTATP